MTRRGAQWWWGAAATALAAALVLALSLALRLPRLDARPMHGDEANQAVRTGTLMETGVYQYDPTDHHGPTLYFAAVPFCRATAGTFAETTEWNFRLVPVFFSCVTLLLMLALGLKRDGGLFENRAGMLAAALLLAVSPAMVYYSRFFIQETMFVTFLTGMLVCGWRYARAAGTGRRARAAWLAAGVGAFAGLAVATKETAVLSFAAAAVALVAAVGWRRLWRAWDWGHFAIAVGSAALVAAVLFSSFFTYPRGLYDAVFSTVSAYLSRATEVPEHQHKWDFYLEILFWFKYGKRGPRWSEAALLLPALVAAVAAFWLRRRGWRGEGAAAGHGALVRFVAVYTLVLTAIYSAIPYKTPWCALSFLHGYVLLAGVGVGWLVGRLQERVTLWGAQLAGYVCVALFVAAVAQRHVAMACRACFDLPADPRNPFVYAHTGMDAMNMVGAIEQAAQKADGYATVIAFAVPPSDTWPLPWYLRKYANVGYWTHVEEIPEGLDPVVVVAASDQGDVADERFGKGKVASFYGVRPGVLLNVFVPEMADGEE